MNLRGCRAMGVILILFVMACIIAAIVAIAHAAPATSYSLYMPVASRPDCGVQAWKGLAGFEINGDASRAICAMRVASVYGWQQVWAHPYISAYPLPSQPVDMVKSPPAQIAFVGFNGITCNSADRLGCVADALSNAGAVEVLVFNEPDNTDENYGDNLTPVLAAQRLKIISDTLLTANPQLKLVVGNFLWPFPTYRAQLIASYIAQYGADPSLAVYSWGYHAYGNVGVHGNDVMANFNDALANAQAQNGSKPTWISEWGADSTGTKPNDYDASYMAQMCAALVAAQVEKAFLFIGARWQPALNASVMNSDGTLSAVGSAYAAC